MPAGHGSKKLEAERGETLSEILEERSAFESMLQRARIANAADVPSPDFATEVLAHFDQITERAKSASTEDEIFTAGYDADDQGQLRAYWCPPDEIENEGKLTIDKLEEWNVPASVLIKLRQSFLPKLEKCADNIKIARSALWAIFKEEDSWARYTSYYEEKMRLYSRILFGAIIGSIAVSLICFHFPRFFLAALFFAGAAGACTSVISKMPMLAVTMSGELEAYERKIWSRVSIGVVASLIGSALLGWGVLSLSIQSQSFADVISACSTTNSCSTPTGLLCTSSKILILLSVPMLFGFSERALTSFELPFFGKQTSN